MRKDPKQFGSVAEMREYFRKTGAIGGKTRAAKMSKKERSESARKAAKARWNKAKSKRNASERTGK